MKKQIMIGLAIYIIGAIITAIVYNRFSNDTLTIAVQLASIFVAIAVVVAMPEKKRI